MIGLVVSRNFSWSNAFWQSSLQWKTASFLVRACKGAAMAAKPLSTGGNNRLNQGKNGLPWLFSGVDVPNSSQERRVRQKSLLCHPRAQVTDLFGSESTFRGPQFELGVPKSLEYLAEPSKVFLPCGGKDNNIIEIK